jgi:hypothetical protein
MKMVVCAAVILWLLRNPDLTSAFIWVAVSGGQPFVLLAVVCSISLGCILLAIRILRRLQSRGSQSRLKATLNEPSPMKLSPDEEMFLRHWMYDEVHYEEGPGPAKRLQVQHRAIPGDLAILIAAAIPDPLEQERAGLDCPSVDPPTWPWSHESLRARIAEARSALGIEPMNTMPSAEVGLRESALEGSRQVR